MAAGCLIGVFILAALLLCTSGLGGTSGFLGVVFGALVLLAAGLFTAEPFSSSVSRAVAAALASEVGASATGEAGVVGAAGLTGAGLGATGVALGTCGGAVASAGGVAGLVVGGFSSTDGDFFLRNSGFGGSSGFFVGFGVVGGVLGFGDAREGTVFGGDGAFLDGVGVEALGSVFSGDFEGVCCLVGIVDAGCGFVLAGVPFVFGGDALFFWSVGAGLAGDVFSEVADFFSSGLTAATGQAAARAATAAVSSDFATTCSGLADETKSLLSTFFGPVDFSSSDTLLLGVRLCFLLDF